MYTDFAAWTWPEAGVPFSYGYRPGEINAAAVSFYEWGVANDELTRLDRVAGLR